MITESISSNKMLPSETSTLRIKISSAQVEWMSRNGMVLKKNGTSALCGGGEAWWHHRLPFESIIYTADISHVVSFVRDRFALF